MPPTIHYFDIKANAFSSMVAAAYWGRELHWEKYSFEDWKKNKNDIKSKCLFNQLPILVDDENVIAQSYGILRYLGKKWHKDGGDNLKDFGKTNTLVEESNDIFKIFLEARYENGNTYDAWSEGLKKLPPHYESLEKLMVDGQFTSDILIGDMALFHVINIAMDLDPMTLKKYKKLKKWYLRIKKNSDVKELLKASKPYFKITKQRTKVALVGSNVSELPKGTKTGTWSEEVTTPYYVFADVGYTVDLYSVNGGKIIIKKESVGPDFKKQSDIRFFKDNVAMSKLENSLPLKELNVENYDLIFFAGGSGPLVDYVSDNVKDVVEEFWKAGKVIAAIGHGSICLANTSFLKRKKITSFSIEEGKAVGGECPVMVETRLINGGADFYKGPAWGAYVIEDQGIVTGQNPASSELCAKKALDLADGWRKYTPLRNFQDSIPIATTTTTTIITTTTTTTTTTTPTPPILKTRKSFKKDRKDTTLKDKTAVKFWDANFPGKDIVSNREFAAPLRKYVEKKIPNLSKQERIFFVNEIVKKFLTVYHAKRFPGKNPRDHIDRHAIQYAINIFGPWIQMFTFISKNFFHSEYAPRPIDFFYGKITNKEARERLKKRDEKRSAKKKRYLLRYGPGHLIISNITLVGNEKILYKDEKLVRKAPSTKNQYDGSTKIPARWRYSYKVATIGGFQVVSKEFMTLGEAFEWLTANHPETKDQNPKIRTPVLIEHYIDDTRGNVSSDPEYEDIMTGNEPEEDSTDEDWVDPELEN